MYCDSDDGGAYHDNLYRSTLIDNLIYLYPHKHTLSPLSHPINQVSIRSFRYEMRLRQKTIQEASIQMNNKKSLREIEGERPPGVHHIHSPYDTSLHLYPFTCVSLLCTAHYRLYHHPSNLCISRNATIALTLSLPLSIALCHTGDVQADVERGTRTLVKSRDDDYDDDDDVEEVKL